VLTSAQLSRNLSNKYGKEYSESAASNREQQVNAQLAQQLALDRPKHSQIYKVMRAACDTYQIDWNDQHMIDLIAQVEGPNTLTGRAARDNEARDQSAARDQEHEHMTDEQQEPSEDEDALMAELNAYHNTRSDTRQGTVDATDLPDVPEPDFDEPEPVPVTASKHVSSPTSGPSSTSSRQSARSTPANTSVTRVKPSTEEDIDLFASNFPQIPSTKTSPGTRSVSGTTPTTNTNTSAANVTGDEDDDLEAKLPRVKTDPRDKKRDSGAGLNDDDLLARFQALKKK
jgi:hypothetical protein